MKTLLLALALFWTSFSFAQVTEMHGVRHGKVGISIYYGDELLNIGSTKLLVLIDERTQEITIKLDPATLKTGVDSLDVKLRTGIQQEILFKGTIPLNLIMQKDKRFKTFEVEGELTVNGVTKPVSLFGSLRKSEQGMGIDGLLYLHFDPKLKDFDLHHLLPLFADFGCVEILQPISGLSGRN